MKRQKETRIGEKKKKGRVGRETSERNAKTERKTNKQKDKTKDRERELMELIKQKTNEGKNKCIKQKYERINKRMNI